MTRGFEATATREGRWWIITVPELGAVTQARTVREIDEMATGLVMALLDLEEDDVKVSVTVELPASVADAWREASELQAKADAGAKRASALRRTAVKELLATGRLSERSRSTARPVVPTRAAARKITGGRPPA